MEHPGRRTKAMLNYIELEASLDYLSLFFKIKNNPKKGIEDFGLTKCYMSHTSALRVRNVRNVSLNFIVKLSSL